MSRVAIGREVFWLLVIAACLSPLWIVEFPAIQDLPQHLAAIRVLHSYNDASFGLHQYFTVELFRTQYLAYYAAANLLAYPLGVELGNRVLMTVCLGALPYAMRTLLRETRGNDELAVFTLPLLYNAHLILGFLNFLAAIPLCLWGLALTLRTRRAPSPRSSLSLALVLLLTFFMHVVPFALLSLGVGVVHLGRDWRGCVRGWLPLLPSLVATCAWLLWSPAGQATAEAARGERGHTVGPVFRTASQAWAAIPMWMTDVLHAPVDDELHVRVTWLLLSALGFGLGLRWTRAIVEHGYPWRLWVLPLVCAVSYFVLPDSYDWIWPIAPRFPLLCLLLAVPVIPRLPTWIARGMALVVLLLALTQANAVGKAFVTFDHDEMGELNSALDAIPEGERVAGLIFARGSRQVKFSPFIHSVAYYQARKGGAVMFTFADFPQSPFRFRDEQRPPRVGPRWEWMPERVNPARELGWYSYVLVRGGPGRIAREQRLYTPVFRGPRWSVWKRYAD